MLLYDFTSTIGYGLCVICHQCVVSVSHVISALFLCHMSTERCFCVTCQQCVSWERI